MADLSPAEVMLNNSSKIKPLIKHMQNVLKGAEPPKGISISRHTESQIAAFQDDLQRYIDVLTTQQKKTAELVKQIPD